MKPSPGSRRVFQSDSFGRYYIVGWLVVAVITIGILVAPRQRPAGAVDDYWAGYITGYVLGLIVVACVVAWLVLRTTVVKLFLDEKGLEIDQGFAKPKRLAWHELKSWDFSFSRSLTLIKQDASKIRVPVHFSDTQGLLDELQRHLPNAEWAALPQGQRVQLQGSRSSRVFAWSLGIFLIMIIGLGAWQSSWPFFLVILLLLSPLLAILLAFYTRNLVRLEFSPQGLELVYPFRTERHPPEILLNARFLGVDMQPQPVARLADGRKLALRQLKPGALSSVGLLNRVIESLPAPIHLDWAGGLAAFTQNVQQARLHRNALINQNELDPPLWMSDPGSHPLGKFYDMQVGLLLRGHLVWGLALDANPILAQEGKADAPLRLAYLREGESSRDPRWLMAELERAERQAGVKALAFQVAQTVGHRHEWPVDMLKSPWFPIWVLEEAPEWCRILPHKYWPSEWQQAWIKSGVIK